MKKFRLMLACVAALAIIHPGTAAEQSIVLASTTSVENSGLLANIIPLFTAKTGIKVNVVAQGTGKALDTARRGDADLLLVHDPEAEHEFLEEGHASARRQIAWNDFIIVGPSADPAHIMGGSDAVAALQKIAEAQAPFVSRGDNSGTMGRALNATSALDAYTLSDRGTWLSFNNKGALVIAIEHDPRLINRYDVIELSPQKHGSSKLAVANVFANWLVSPEGQAAIGAYQVNWERLFNPSTGSPK